MILLWGLSSSTCTYPIGTKVKVGIEVLARGRSVIMHLCSTHAIPPEAAQFSPTVRYDSKGDQDLQLLLYLTLFRISTDTRHGEGLRLSNPPGRYVEQSTAREYSLLISDVAFAPCARPG